MCFQLLSGARPVAVTWPDKALLKYRQCGFKAVRKRTGMLFRKFFRHGQGLGCNSAAGKSDRGSSWAQARPRAAREAARHPPISQHSSGLSSPTDRQVRAVAFPPGALTVLLGAFTVLLCSYSFLLWELCLERKWRVWSCGIFAEGLEELEAGCWFLANFASGVILHSSSGAAPLVGWTLCQKHPWLFHFGEEVWI